MFGLWGDEWVQLKGRKAERQGKVLSAILPFCHPASVSDSFLDHLPSREREKIRKRLRSPEEYERFREKVKGPEDLERELKRSERMAEVHFRIETEPEIAQRLHDRIAKDVKERGVKTVLEDAHVSDSVRTTLEQGRFTVSVEAHPKTHEDVLVVVPEGNVHDTLPMKPMQSERYVQMVLASPSS